MTHDELAEVPKEAGAPGLHLLKETKRGQGLASSTGAGWHGRTADSLLCSLSSQTTVATS